ncbi:MAG: FliA/WhiG family RNA polymerase sigma factor [Clostridiales bacterium]|nr:FliA/WhiG family RNA polymerase sigma factor [Clostridiales bacterium]
MSNITNEDELIMRYLETGDISLRNEIILKYQNVVKYIAISMRGTYIKYADVDDIINEGIIALMAALDNFDPEKKVKFETYASIKIRGAIIDFVRKQDWVPRNVRRFNRDLERAYSELSASLDRAPTDEELASKLGLDKDKFYKSMADIAGMVTFSFEQLVYENNFEIGDDNTGSGISSTEKGLYGQELEKVIAQAIDGLGKQERIVISLYYYEKLKFTDIAKVLEVSDSRVSQIHTKAMLSLKDKLKEYVLD